jgi:hypothetical protein
MASCRHKVSTTHDTMTGSEEMKPPVKIIHHFVILLGLGVGRRSARVSGEVVGGWVGEVVIWGETEGEQQCCWRWWWCTPQGGVPLLLHPHKWAHRLLSPS